MEILVTSDKIIYKFSLLWQIMKTIYWSLRIRYNRVRLFKQIIKNSFFWSTYVINHSYNEKKFTGHWESVKK